MSERRHLAMDGLVQEQPPRAARAFTLLAQSACLAASVFLLVGAWRQVLLNLNMAAPVSGWPHGLALYGRPSRRCASVEGDRREVQMASEIDAFVARLDAGEPPAVATPMLRALWHGLRGDWDAAHELAQAQDDAEGAWVHAWLHRVEGDLGNADYWYRRAHQPPRRDDTRQEGLDIARALMAGRA